MRVLRLEIQGFKSFARPVRLEFDAGIAGIVGPNGSGKSNLVDAVRWVLGEQSLSQLRGKRTEDVIWAGTTGRAASGMAEVSITFDNADRSLPIAFSEVTVTRRAYRSGENEYLLNRSRVRLRDINELVSAIGQGYTVVGQGTADAALSLTPEGRRDLFEEAADIAQHYARRDDALRRFAEIETNTARVSDLLAELEPRLRALARQARQARDRATEESRLRDLRLAYFSGEIRRSAQALEEARGALRTMQERVARLVAERDETAAAETEAARSHAALEARLAELSAERAALDGRERAAGQAEVLADARRAELCREVERGEARLRSLREACMTAERELRDATDAATAAHRAASAACEELQEHERSEAGRLGARDEAVRRSDELRGRVYTAEETAARARNKATVLEDRLETARAECEQRRAESRDHEADLRERLADARRGEEAYESARRRAAELDAALARATAEARSAAAALAEREAAAADRLTRARALRGRLRTLEDGQGHGGGFGRAVQAVLRAGEAGELRGVHGPLGVLLRVPHQLERAVEAALGGAVQNVVVEEWRQAEEAISLLKRTGAGRVTFLPLDTLHPAPPSALPRGTGVVGLAADLVECDAPVRPALLHALGRVLVVEDLADARALIRRMSGLSSIVTVEGEMVRPGGSVTGGAAGREAGLLARQRELRDLRARARVAEGELPDLQKAVDALRLRARAATGEEKQARTCLEAALRDGRAAQERVEHNRRAVARAEQDAAWARAATERAGAELTQLRAAAMAAAVDREAAERIARKAADAVSAATRDAEEAERAGHDAEEALGRLRTRAAVADERLRSAESRVRQAREIDRRARAVVEGERAALDRLRRGLRAAEEAAARAAADHATVLRDARESDERLLPIRRELATQVPRLRRLRSEGATLAASLLDAEASRLALAAAVRRTEDGRLALLDRAERETGCARVPEDLEPPEGVEALISAAADRLARLGPINALADREHGELQARREFLEGQVRDLQTARDDLRRLVRSIEEQMEARFEETFSAVSERFGTYFQRLFGGGEARLALVTRGDGVGVEIRAQPPGKRLGSLALLSGGERALTSSALLFALISAGGAPFCVLDEVDAALDESNIGRFCDLLGELARDTQFIVVTHNRGTIERASTLYGVSMEASGVSSLLGLRLADAREEAARASA